jgi:hypothetical protein
MRTCGGRLCVPEARADPEASDLLSDQSATGSPSPREEKVPAAGQDELDIHQRRDRLFLQFWLRIL